MQNIKTFSSQHRAFSMSGKTSSFTINHYVTPVKYSPVIYLRFHSVYYFIDKITKRIISFDTEQVY